MAVEIYTRANDWDDFDQMAAEAELYANGHGGYPEAPAEILPLHKLNKEMAGWHGAALLLHDGMPAIVPDSAKRAGPDNFIG